MILSVYGQRGFVIIVIIFVYVNLPVEGGNGYVKLKELLVEDSWLGALPEELEKPYAKNLCKFVENEICGGKVPIYPPQHLIFNALNSTPFDRVKAVILGQVSFTRYCFSHFMIYFSCGV